ncbi:hypothetical protein [Cupriavidus campinensis]|uniref:hypothetical protein n=1 Tax=Cupriavidus campinensis TaxID=151783 RepID=UPI0021CCE1FF|nr:hypothetical protein [Cupriavidus campinensis]
MSIASTTLLSLQQAGESLYAARQAFAQEVQHNASRVVGIVASEPFSNDADRAYGQLRTIARMAHELQAMEEQLKTLYGSAMELTAPRHRYWSHSLIATQASEPIRMPLALRVRKTWS